MTDHSLVSVPAPGKPTFLSEQERTELLAKLAEIERQRRKANTGRMLP